MFDGVAELGTTLRDDGSDGAVSSNVEAKDHRVDQRSDHPLEFLLIPHRHLGAHGYPGLASRRLQRHREAGSRNAEQGHALGLGGRDQAVAKRAGQQHGADDALEAPLLRPGTIARDVEAAEILKLLAPMGASAIERTAGMELFFPQRVVAMMKVDIGEFWIVAGM